MPDLVYNTAKELLASGLLDWETADLRVLLVESTYVENADHNFVSDVWDESTDPAYTRKALTGLTVTKDTVNDRAVLDAANVSWVGMDAGETLGGAVIFIHSGADASAKLIRYIEFTPFVTDGRTITLQFSADGIVVLE